MLQLELGGHQPLLDAASLLLECVGTYRRSWYDLTLEVSCERVDSRQKGTSDTNGPRDRQGVRLVAVWHRSSHSLESLIVFGVMNNPQMWRMLLRPQKGR